MFLHLKTAVFPFWSFNCAACGFSPIESLVFVFANNDGGFSDFSAQCISYGFCGFAMEVRSRTAVKTVVPRKQLQLGERVTSQFSLAAVIWFVTAAKQTIRYNNVKSNENAMAEQTET